MAKASVLSKDTKRFSKAIDSCKRISRVIEKRDCRSFVIYELPFKVRITNITVPGYGQFNVPPIGIAIIGVNNYIL